MQPTYRPTKSKMKSSIGYKVESYTASREFLWTPTVGWDTIKWDWVSKPKTVVGRCYYV